MSFQAVNTGLAPEPYNRTGEETTPTTPRPTAAPTANPPPSARLDDATTPTRASFGALASQKPLPAAPFPTTVTVPENAEPEKKPLVRGDSQYSAKSTNSEDVDMDENSGGEEEEGSDEESINADGTRTTKKKKSQRFWCTEYPPCQLSFTRSEHLARHIRKHTGERPFQCHCSRRFSRLDNLRQHAQTVHLNEDIPPESLAATGTRFQRQVRTDRVRPSTGNRVRAGTAGSVASQGRGHHRNSLSASSIGSMASTYNQRDDMRRRPPPLVMADSRARLSDYSAATESPGQYQTYRPQSPSGYSTPTSATFSTGQNSPRWGSGMQSPVSAHSRTASIYAGHRTPQRRLSVPSGANPFQSPHGASYGPPPLSSLNSSTQPLFSPSSSMLASPTISTSGSTWSRRESIGQDDYRRRTWHPETYSSFQHPLSNVTRPNYYDHGHDHSTQLPRENSLRLPGIESFDPLPPRPSTPPRRAPSPMDMEYTPSKLPAVHASEYPRPDDRRNHSQWDTAGLHANLTRLDLTRAPPSTPPTDTISSWGSEVNRAVQAQGDQVRSQPSIRFEPNAYPPRETTSSYQTHQHRISAPPLTPRDSRRHGWYSGPPAPVVVQHDLQSQHQSQNQRTSPEGSSSSEGGVPGTPGSASVADYHPSIMHSNGQVDPAQIPPPQHAYGNYAAGTDSAYTYAPGPGPRSVMSNGVGMGHNGIRGGHTMRGGNEKATDSNMLRLEALVAVATSEKEGTAAY